jgi:hypothetical protein
MTFATHYVNIPEATRVISKLGFALRHLDLWRYKYHNLRASAPKRKSVLRLSFYQYMRLAKKAGIRVPSQIGKSSDKYQMSRKGDTGDYVWGNCRFLTMRENLEEKKANGGVERGAQKHRGRTKLTDVGCAKISAALTGRTKENDLGRRITSTKLTGRKRPASVYASRLKPFVVVSPAGLKYRGKNLSSFCRKHGLDQGGMSRALRGRQRSHNGWTGNYTEKAL